MKLKIQWKELGKALWAAIKPVLLGAIGGGIVGISTGCSSMTPTNKTQTMRQLMKDFAICLNACSQ